MNNFCEIEWINEGEYGNSLINGNIEDTIKYVFKNLEISIKLIKRTEHNDDVNDDGFKYKTWYVEPENNDPYYMYFKLYEDDSWSCVWS
jgi:hypothetical protein